MEIDKQKKSCGILLKHEDKYLIGHATSQEHWTVFKGCQDDGETEKETAYREFQEETGLDLKSLNIDIGEPIHEYYTYSGKTVKIFTAEDVQGITLSKNLKCNSFVDNDPNFPEIDNYMWATKEQARRLVYPSQRNIFK